MNQRDKPLALYVFSRRRPPPSRVLERTSAGGVCVNHAVLHLASPELPFGGVGPERHGRVPRARSASSTFSHRKRVLTKPTRPDPPALYPPYTRLKRWLLRRAL